MNALPLMAALLSFQTIGADHVSIPSTPQLAAWWFEAKTREPRPAIIGLHGCGGALDAKGELAPAWHRDAAYFNAEKMHYLALDSFTPRGLKSICELPEAKRTIDPEGRREDVFAAIQWLAQRPNVDKAKIAILGRSHGAATVLSVLDRSDRAVQGQPILPRAGIALYPGCSKFVRRWTYEIAAPLLLMTGELDDWTPAMPCVWLQEKVRRAQKEAVFELVEFPASHHGFDGLGPVRIRENVGNTRSGRATVGGNPEARVKAHERAFEFLATAFSTPLSYTHAERLAWHRYMVPPDRGFARIEDLGAVPLGQNGRSRYEHFLGLQAPKAFAITEKGGWFFSSGAADAMRIALGQCEKAKARCWLYAVDDRVVWDRDPSLRVDLGKLQAVGE
jgi:dienelactone hydrolase